MSDTNFWMWFWFWLGTAVWVGCAIWGLWYALIQLGRDYERSITKQLKDRGF